LYKSWAGSMYIEVCAWLWKCGCAYYKSVVF
jgi:hypothetical protein